MQCEEELYNFAYLPQHIICDILSYLKPKDFKRAITVCNLWYDASFHPKFNKKFQFIFRNTYLDYKKPKYIELFNGPRYFRTLSFQYCKFTEEFVINIPIKFLKYVKELHILNCIIKFEEFYELILKIENLEHLSFEAVNFKSFFCENEIINFDNLKNRDIFDKNISKLKKLKFSCGHTNNDHFAEIFRSVNNLEEFYYSGFPVAVNASALWVNFIIKNAKTIKIVETFGRMFTEEIQNKVTNLNEIYINYDDWAGLTEILINNRKIYKIKVMDLRNNLLDNICATLQDLKSFEVLSRYSENFNCLKNMTKLERICIPINDQEIFHIFENNNPIIQILKIKSKINMESVKIIASKCPNLKELELLSIECTDARGFEGIFKNLLKLRKLILLTNSKNSLALEASPEWSIKNMSSLKVLKLKGPFNFISLREIICLKHLEILDVIPQFNPNEDDILNLSNECRGLEELSFYKINALSYDIIEIIRSRLINLTILNIYGCKNAKHNNNNTFISEFDQNDLSIQSIGESYHV